MVQHVVVDEGYGAPENAYEASELLAGKGIFGPNEVHLFRKMVGFRNVVDHDYISIDKRVVHLILTTRLDDIRRLVSRITARFL